MPKKFFSTHFGKDTDKLKNNKLFHNFLGRFLLEANLWHFNRRSVKGGVAIGVFIGFTPIIGQMLSAALLSMLFRVNLPIAVALVWITNPFTIVPFFYMTYQFGNWILGKENMITPFAMDIAWFTQTLGQIWQPLFLGSFIIASISAFLSYLCIDWLWKLSVYLRWKKRNHHKNSLLHK